MAHAKTIAAHWARTAVFSTQGELLCTTGLGYLLDHPSLGRDFANHLLKNAGQPTKPDLRWRAEYQHPDGSRPDLEAVADSAPWIRLEAKLSAAFGPDQLVRYAEGLPSEGLVAVLIPKTRNAETSRHLDSVFDPGAKAGTWTAASGARVAILVWEEALEVIEQLAPASEVGDAAQLRGLYLALTGSDLAPLTSPDLLDWHGRRDDLRELVDLTTRQLTTERPRVYPMREWQPGYDLRYVFRNVGGEDAFFAIGLRDPFDPYTTPVWMQYHHDTGGFAGMRARIVSSALRFVESGGHLWFPLDPLTDAPPDLVVESLVAQATAIHRIAIGEESAGV